MSDRLKRVLSLFVLYVSIESPAYAYLDPATGSIIIQAIVGAVGTAVVYYNLCMNRTKDFFRGIFGRNSKKSHSE
jgi:hypothetical protein